MQKTLYILYYIQAFHLFVIHKITPYQEVNFDWVLKNPQHLNRVIMLWGYMFLINKICESLFCLFDRRTCTFVKQGCLFA